MSRPQESRRLRWWRARRRWVLWLNKQALRVYDQCLSLKAWCITWRAFRRCRPTLAERRRLQQQERRRTP